MTSNEKLAEAFAINLNIVQGYGDCPVGDVPKEAIEQALQMALRTQPDAQPDVAEAMTQRFLNWKLPEHFSPDAGISFEPEFNVEWNAKQGRPPQRHEPVGTNLFSYDQAKQMVEYMLEGIPALASEARETQPRADDGVEAARELARLVEMHSEYFCEEDWASFCPVLAKIDRLTGDTQ